MKPFKCSCHRVRNTWIVIFLLVIDMAWDLYQEQQDKRNNLKDEKKEGENYIDNKDILKKND